jgi:hypothetical protein
LFCQLGHARTLEDDHRRAGGLRREFLFKQWLLSLDATMIPLCLSMFDRALRRRSKGAVKLRLAPDHSPW